MPRGIVALVVVVVQGSRAHHNGGMGLQFNVARAAVVDSELSFNGIGAWFDEGAGSFERVDVHDNVEDGAVFNNADGYVWTSRFYANGAGRYALRSSDSVGPSRGFTSSSTAEVTERRLPLARASRASLARAERLDLRLRASSLNASSKRSKT